MPDSTDTSCGSPKLAIKSRRSEPLPHSQSDRPTNRSPHLLSPETRLVTAKMKDTSVSRRLSLDSDYGLSSSTSTIDPNESFYSDCSSCVSILSDSDDDVFIQSLVMRADSMEGLECGGHTAAETSQVLAFSNTDSLSEDLRYVNGIPEMCDVRFLVGTPEVAIFGVKAILCARSRVLCKQILLQERLSKKGKQSIKRKRLGILRFLRGKRRGSKSPGTEPHREPLTIHIPDIEPEIFRKVVLFLHSGTITVDFSNVIGLMAAAEVYGLEDLTAACCQFARRFINERAVLPLLQSSHAHPQSEIVLQLTGEALVFIDKSAETVLQQEAFLSVCQTTVSTILARTKLRASAEAKWDAALRWSRRHCPNDVGDLRNILKSFTPHINLLEIPLSKLMDEVTPLCSDHVTGLHRESSWMESMTSVCKPEPECYRKSSVSSAGSLTARSTDSGYTSSYRESCLL